MVLVAPGGGRRPGAVERYDFAFPFHARVVPRGAATGVFTIDHPL